MVFPYVSFSSLKFVLLLLNRKPIFLLIIPSSVTSTRTSNYFIEILLNVSVFSRSLSSLNMSHLLCRIVFHIQSFLFLKSHHPRILYILQVLRGLKPVSETFGFYGLRMRSRKNYKCLRTD